MSAPALSLPADPASLSWSALAVAIRQVALPLMSAACEVKAMGSGGESEGATTEASVFVELLEHVVRATESSLARHGATDPVPDSVRWAMAGAASSCVAALYRVSGRVPEQQEIEGTLAALLESPRTLAVLGSAVTDCLPNTAATFRARLIDALAPVVGAVAQYSYGRPEHALLSDVTARIFKMGDQVTRALAPRGLSAEDWRILTWNVVRALCQLYSDAHYAEADRLLYLDPTERDALIQKNKGVMPMDRVWQAFDQRVSMLATLAAYLEIPETATLDAQDLS
ncbi:MAG: hypothetical protein IPI58_01085 [Alphaproteobacteria bacterium]|nr:MAG: hypothetical protein IPI58_01085 [Alphaproteobacteria bacterium]